MYDDEFTINPASGLPMIGDALDIAGNPYGTNSDAGWDTDFGTFTSDDFGIGTLID